MRRLARVDCRLQLIVNFWPFLLDVELSDDPWRQMTPYHTVSLQADIFCTRVPPYRAI